jgi:alpha-glucuronidase
MGKTIVYRFMKAIFLALSLIISLGTLSAEDGYDLWLRYHGVLEESIRDDYRSLLQFVEVEGNSEVLVSARVELMRGLTGLLEVSTFYQSADHADKGVLAGVVGQSPKLDRLLGPENGTIGPEAYRIVAKDGIILIAGGDDRGVLYGAFHFLRLLQTRVELGGVDIAEAPRLQLRMLNHWDNLDRTVERGYAGFSIWNWHELPHRIDQRYVDYARANASVGINAVTVTNVNANALVFREDYLEKAAALAAVFRKYGIKIFLTARFSAPVELGGLPTADPLDPAVAQWWKTTANRIYARIPDFGGFLVKANSEGQPGPQDYGRNHAEGANVLADALAPHGGVVMWRAFVYSSEAPEDRAKQAYNEFVPLDGRFRDNVLIQVKNGAIDFQPREPAHPLFGATPKTPLMMEFQITKEYLGQGTHLVGLAPFWEEVLQTDMHRPSAGTTVANILDGSAYGNRLTGMAGVANIGTARNWTGHHFGQADWYAFGRLAWNPELTAEEIYREWTRMTFSGQKPVESVVMDLLMNSHATCVQYMTPLGLHHIMAAGHHYGPGPWVDFMPRDDWNCTYYHRADSLGVGFDRTATGSDALSQYAPGYAEKFADPKSCPPEFLLWYHHVPWDFPLASGKTLWDELFDQYVEGAEKAARMQQQWEVLETFLDHRRFEEVRQHLTIQAREASWWRDACLVYFQSLSGRSFPRKPEGFDPAPLQTYLDVSHPYAPGIRPQW